MSWPSPWAALSGCGSSDQVTLNVYNWGINIADGPRAAWTISTSWRSHGEIPRIHVNYTTYEDNESSTPG